jgi:hypothetical protein
MQEASHHAGQAGRDLVTARTSRRRCKPGATAPSRLHEAIQEQILRGSLLIDSGGGQVGQVNGLAVIDLGDDLFAHPVRITATARIGEGDVIDIERESELGGAIHSKGVMILAAFLAARYAAACPCPCRPAWSSSSPTARWKATAPRWRNCAPCSRRWPPCRSAVAGRHRLGEPVRRRAADRRRERERSRASSTSARRAA